MSTDQPRLPEAKTEDQWRARQDWRFRAVTATRGNQTMLGAIVIAVLGMQRDTKPQFGRSANISPEGVVYSEFTARDGTVHPAQVIGTLDYLLREWRNLMDAIKLNDEDRTAMALALRSWINEDQRPDDVKERKLS